MWFKSFKAFKENPENKAILFAVARYILFTYRTTEEANNQHWRENFVDEWLAEPVIVPVKLVKKKPHIGKLAYVD